jgi:hypothetical protein
LRTPPNSKKPSGVARRAKGFFADIPSLVARNEKSRNTAHEFDREKTYMLLLPGQPLFARRQMK